MSDILKTPKWLRKNIPLEVQENLVTNEEDFLTKPELQQVMETCGFHVQGSFDSSKEDWEFYIRPVNQAMREIIESMSELEEEAQMVINSFKAEYDAVNQYWNMVLWVAEAI